MTARNLSQVAQAILSRHVTPTIQWDYYIAEKMIRKIMIQHTAQVSTHDRNIARDEDEFWVMV